MKETINKEAQATILWIEDEQDLREILTQELLDAGYRVIEAVNGQDALNQLKICRPDLILCDIAMPVMDGYTLLHLVRETMHSLSDVPFVFLSAQDGSHQIIQGKYAGADDYLVKPVNFDLMLATIAARLRQVQRVRHKLSDTPNRPTKPINRQHQFDNQTFRRLANMFNLVTGGVILLDRDGTIVFANTSAQRLLFECIDPAARSIFSVGGILNCDGLYSAIRIAINAALNQQEYTEFLSIPRSNEQRDLLVTVCTHHDVISDDDNFVAIALFISASGNNEPIPIKALESLFKLTPTEGRIAWAFAQGLRPDQIAKRFDISLTTVAFHKRNIFQKTNTNRQADLIALLLTLPACVNQECTP
ncbi:MAG: response regulator [Alcaligenaceae bacterium]|jgi:DNA-binding NarL/FixJ family response regulator|nr:response regulator [Alcaligenaceae bacterium]